MDQGVFMASKPPPLRRTAQKDKAAPPTEEAVQSVSQPTRLDEASFEPAIQPAADPAPSEEDEEDLLVGAEEELVEAEEHSGLMKLFYGFGSCGISLIIHLVGLVLLAYLTVPTHDRNVQAFVEAMFDPRNEDDPVEFELDTEIQISTEMTAASISTSAMTGVTVGAQGTVGIPQLDQQVLKEAAAAAEVGQISIDHPLSGAPGFTQLIAAVPDKEFKGDPRAIIDNYEQAMDRIAQELMWMMEKGPVW
jgi:hypothetical protein